MKLINKSKKQNHIDRCAKYLVDRDLDWYTDCQSYLSAYWNAEMPLDVFDDYRDFVSNVSNSMDRIMIGRLSAVANLPRVVVDNTRYQAY